MEQAPSQELFHTFLQQVEIKNIRVVDRMADSLAYPDDTIDIVMPGHVIGDDYGSELSEIFRVVRSGDGWLTVPARKAGNVSRMRNC